MPSPTLPSAQSMWGDYVPFHPDTLDYLVEVQDHIAERYAIRAHARTPPESPHSVYSESSVDSWPPPDGFKPDGWSLNHPLPSPEDSIATRENRPYTAEAFSSSTARVPKLKATRKGYQCPGAISSGRQVFYIDTTGQWLTRRTQNYKIKSFIDNHILSA